MSDFNVGDVLEDRYRIDYPIARGGMSTVFRCVDLRLGRAVAAKVMDRKLAADPVFLSRFRREARAMAQLSHPHLVGVYDFSAGKAGTDQPVFLIMELITGGTLRELLAERGPMPAHAAVEVIRGVLTGLNAAHRAGLIHRDIKPENVLISGEGVVKISDFGLVRSLESAQVQSSDIIGTPAYISPEQVSGEPITTATDVYATGILLFELLTGTTPFKGDTPLAQAKARLHTDVPAPSARMAGIPSLLDALVATATAREPAVRFTDAAEFLEALNDVARELALPSFQVPVPRNSAAHRAAAIPADTSVLPTVMNATGFITEISPLPSLKDHSDSTATAPELSNSTGETTVLPLAQPEGLPSLRSHVAAETMVNIPASPAQFEPDVESLQPPPGAPGAPGVSGAPAAPKPLSNRSPWLLALWWLIALGLIAAVAVGGWWFGSGRYGEVPQVIGMDKISAVSVIRDSGFTASAQEIYSDEAPKNTIIATDPDVRQKAVRGSEIAVLVSLGKPQIPAVPEHATLASYQALLTKRSLNFEIGEAVYSDTVAEGELAETTPTAGREVATGSVIILHPSKGPAPVQVPDISGLSLEQAKKVLEGAGLKIAKTTHSFADTIAADHVILTHPEAGVETRRGTAIEVELSNALTVPDIRSLALNDAKKMLADAGLTIDKTVKTSDTVGKSADEVLAVIPSPGALVDPADPRVVVALPAKISVPRVTAKTFEEAREILQASGLELDDSSTTPSNLEARVFSQSPRPGTEVKPHTKIRLRTIG
ncbi:PASTA domain-containing protein [Corynebacterium caspium]|uniref:PASTA domain-containing protein n=1 Tax=Corynebacterium caspium TaxID=234828 RepID=UPI00037D49AF|nr:PASTA domain-containing protein [Corynebacterium caspium]WKD58980.1 Serine/threonine-protein kinase PknL [Corynebacterium caspium DSM 44850]